MPSGQAAMFGTSADGVPDSTVKAWAAATTRKVGKGSQRVVEADDDLLEELEYALDALADSCYQGEEHAAARACRTGHARVVEARRMLAAATLEPAVIDLGEPEGGRYWRVVTGESADHEDALNAAVHARATGSVGATYNGVTVEAVKS